VKTNLRVSDPLNQSVQVLDGEVTADGFEASASGYITKLWQIIASYTYVHARVTKTSSAFQLNTEPLNTPAHSFSLWTTYDITPKWQIGGGVFYSGEVYGDAGSATVPQSALVPDWWRVDLMAAYKVTKQSTLQLNVYNVTDKNYYQSAYSNWAVPASGRLFALTYRVKFAPDDAPKSSSMLPTKTAAYR
jgi:catecholate siderophore receptor